MESQTKKIVYIAAIVIAVFGVGWLIGRISAFPPPPDHRGRPDDKIFSRDAISSEWHFINPLLDCTELSNISNRNIADIKSSVISYIASINSTADTVAVYFRDLNNGPNFGVNDNIKFYPASLLKVPLMMGVYKQAMTDPLVLQRKFTFTGPSRNNEHFRAPQELLNGREYTGSELLGYMIKFSDNNASHLLTDMVNLNDLSQTYTELGIALPDATEYAISVKDYASFFRILYNGTFLSREYSEQALQLLSQTAFNNGLVAGLPPGITVAHKFGERQINGEKQLHDCGIVYVPGHPYLLCVMSRGTDFEKLDDVIEGVSKIVYAGVTSEAN